MRINQNISQRQTQTLLIKPKMLQSLEILAAPIMELETFLAMELQKNPMLELLDDDIDDARNTVKEDVSDEPKPDVDGDPSAEMKELLEETRQLSEVLDSWSEYTGENYTNLRSSDDLDFEDKYSTNRNMITDENERDRFLEQLEDYELSEMEFDYAEELLESANAHGFLPEDLDIYALAEEYQISAERADEIHLLLLNMEPRGITARTMQECLIVQLDKDDIHYEHLEQVIREDFDDLIHKRYKKISSKYGVAEKTILFWKEMIGNLDPKPGLRIIPFDPDYVTPDVIIKKIGDRFEIISNDFSYSRVKLSRNYLNILNTVKDDKEAVDFVRERINAAKFIIKSVYLRGRTLERVVQAIIKHQSEFFYEENGTLRPLTYAVIADELQVNESTISRVVRSKYAETPFGMMCLKDFFTSKAGKDENYNSISRHSVEVRLQEMIEEEDGDNPLSDLDIARLLRKEGMTVSRRVVAKYRKKLGILNSHLRSKD
ncbi:MAG: RNA polymerase factor sigma-54 [Candidatus Cloacimonetes bacterium]|nr:RNA polymerase factor sigma-54 [Candidatus Cloacimonadota bacterium]